MSVYSLGSLPFVGVENRYDDLSLMKFENRITQLTNEAAENAAQLVLTQLSERLNLTKHQSKIDEEMECLQFGICSYQSQPQKINF